MPLLLPRREKRKCAKIRKLKCSKKKTTKKKRGKLNKGGEYLKLKVLKMMWNAFGGELNQTTERKVPRDTLQIKDELFLCMNFVYFFFF